MGTERMSFVELQQRIGSQTGGLSAHSLVSARLDDGPAATYLFLRGKAMAERVADLTAIVRDVLLEGRLDDQERFLQMALEERASAEASLVPGGHRVVLTRLRAQFDETGWLSEQMRGLSYLFFLRQLIEDIRNDWPAVQARLEQIRALLVNRPGMLCNATVAGGDRAVCDQSLAALLDELPQEAHSPATWTPHLTAADEGLTVPAQVNYVGKAADLFALGYELDGASAVITRYLATTWLWDRVAGCKAGPTGPFAPSTRFPAYSRTRRTATPTCWRHWTCTTGAAPFLRDYPISNDELTKAIIGTIGDFDAYQLPDAKGYASLVRYLTGIDDDYRQQMRDQVLGTKAEHFADFAAVLDQGWLSGPGCGTGVGRRDCRGFGCA